LVNRTQTFIRFPFIVKDHSQQPFHDKILPMTELIGNSARLRTLADAGGERVVNQVDDAVSSSSFKSLINGQLLWFVTRPTKDCPG
jgi:hypothetical protein